MNLIDLVVTEVTSKPVQMSNGTWLVDIMAEAYGITQQTHIFCDSLDIANSICVGYEFLG